MKPYRSGETPQIGDVVNGGGTVNAIVRVLGIDPVTLSALEVRLSESDPYERRVAGEQIRAHEDSDAISVVWLDLARGGVPWRDSPPWSVWRSSVCTLVERAPADTPSAPPATSPAVACERLITALDADDPRGILLSVAELQLARRSGNEPDGVLVERLILALAGAQRRKYGRDP